MALQTARTGRDLRAPHGAELPMFFHTASLQFESQPDKPDPVYAHKLPTVLNAVNASQLGGQLRAASVCGVTTVRFLSSSGSGVTD